MPRLDEGGIGRLVGLGAGVGLHVGVGGAEELAGAVAREVLDEVDLLAAAVVALAGVALCVLVGEDGAHGLHHRGAGDVLGCDELDLVALASELGVDDAGDVWVGVVEVLEGHGTTFLRLR